MVGVDREMRQLDPCGDSDIDMIVIPSSLYAEIGSFDGLCNFRFEEKIAFYPATFFSFPKSGLRAWMAQNMSRDERVQMKQILHGGIAIRRPHHTTPLQQTPRVYR